MATPSVLLSLPIDHLRSKGEHYLVRASLKAFPLQFLSPIIPRILLLVALFMQPLLAAGMIEFISHPEQPSDRGWALAGGFVCTYALIFLMTSIYWEKVSFCCGESSSAFAE